MDTDQANITAGEFADVAINCDLAKAKDFIDRGYDVNTQHYEDIRGERYYEGNPVFLAIYSEDEENREAMVRMLVEAGADLDEEYDRGESPLIAIIIEKFSMEAIRHMLQYGPDLEVSDFSERTALFFSAEHTDAEIMGLLLDAGANPFAKDEHFKTALDFLNEGKGLNKKEVPMCRRLLRVAMENWS